MTKLSSIAFAAVAGLSVASAQTFQRLGSCPDLGCVLPPDQSDFLPGQYFDLRVEVHAPVNGSEAFNDGKPDENFSVTIKKEGGESSSLENFFDLDEPELEKWKFSWFEDLYAEDAGEASDVNVASKIWRRIALYEPGQYEVTLSYYGNQTTTANWTVRPVATEKKAKNIIFFIGDGMTTNMITAARLLGHKSINGKYQSKLKLDEFPVLGHQMTHSIDTFITDSANSASALYSGHKSTVNAMGVYADSSPDAFDDPKVETIVELSARIWGTIWGAVSTAFMADATPIALTGHTRSRSHYGPLIEQALNGVQNYSWSQHNGPAAYFGAGAEQFIAGDGSFEGKDYYEVFADAGYTVSLNKTSLEASDSSEKGLGIFCQSNLPTWLDRNVYTENIKDLENDPAGGEGAATDLPGLKEMTLKAVEILSNRAGEEGFFLMSEAASIDKQMHALDYDRALGDLLELDDTVRATIELLEELGELEETLVVVSADHGHGFDVFGNADTKYLSEQEDDRSKRRAVGTYARSGLSEYTSPNPSVTYGTGPNFPLNWEPRYAIAAGFGANPDRREDYKVHSEGARTPTKPLEDGASDDYYVNPEDAVDGFIMNGSIPTNEAQGIHSLTDVMVYAWGPCQETFGGTYDNTDIFYKMATCFGLAQPKDGAGAGASENGQKEDGVGYEDVESGGLGPETVKPGASEDEPCSTSVSQ